MTMNPVTPDPVRRITDLFVEGEVVYLGDHPVTHTPVVVWVNKLNSFEREECQRDGILRRSERLAELTKGSPETRAVEVEMSFWSDEELVAKYVEGQASEIYLEALDNLSVRPDFRELEDWVRRGPQIQETAATGDTRIATLEAKIDEYTTRLALERQRVADERTAQYGERPRVQMEKAFLEEWRTNRAFADFADTKRVSELYFSVRVCKATLLTTELSGERVWDHSACDHNQRFFTDRDSIRRLPDEAMLKIADVYNQFSMAPRDAGNWDAPSSSATSSEPSSTVAETSPVSFPAETPVAAPGT